MNEDIVNARGRALEEHGLDRGIRCVGCRFGMAYRRAKHLDVVTWCNWMRREVPNDIADCTNFMDQRQLDMEEMKRSAIIIDKRLPGGNFL